MSNVCVRGRKYSCGLVIWPPCVHHVLSSGKTAVLCAPLMLALRYDPASLQQKQSLVLDMHYKPCGVISQLASCVFTTAPLQAGIFHLAGNYCKHSYERSHRFHNLHRSCCPVISGVLSPSLAGVIDVAGGRGEVAFQLQTLRGIPTTVIDPRPGKLSRSQHRQLAALRGNSQSGNPTVNATSSTLDNPLNGGAANEGRPSVDTPLAGDKTVEDGDLLSPIREAEGLGLPHPASSAAISPAGVDQEEKGLGCSHSAPVGKCGPKSFASSHMASPGARGADLRGKLPEHLCCEFGPALWDGPLGERLRNGSVVVGLHPDQVWQSFAVA
jgi:hypothetical protein